MQTQQKELEYMIARASWKAIAMIAVKLERQREDINKRYDALTRRKNEMEEVLALN